MNLLDWSMYRFTDGVRSFGLYDYVYVVRSEPAG